MSAPRIENNNIEASPGQLYITASGHLYHAGKICIVMVGLPARGKTARTVAISRYLSWLGVKVKKFHLSDYRRKILGSEKDLPGDFFSFTAKERDQLLSTATEEIWEFFGAGGQVALYDAINPLASQRRELAKMFADRGVECLFVECAVTDEKILARNIAEINRASPEYSKIDSETAADLHLKKLKQTFEYYEPLTEPELIYIKIQNEGEKLMVNHGPLGYLLNRVLLFNLNARKRRGSIFFARSGNATDNQSVGAEDDDLTNEGQAYSQALFDTLVKYMSSPEYPHHDDAGLDPSEYVQYADAHESRAQSPIEESKYNLVVLTSSRTKTVQTSAPFKKHGFPTTPYSLMTQRKQGAPLGEDYWEQYKKDPYHTAYPRGESFQDVALRLEPVLLELERIDTSVLIIAHESVLSVLYGYFKGSSTKDIPELRFPANRIIELSSTGYEHERKEIIIEGATNDGRVVN